MLHFQNIFSTIQHEFFKAMQIDGNAMEEVFPRDTPGTQDTA